jgi:DNA-binding response OmpR family regulator
MMVEVRQALIVDDEPQVRAQLTRALETNGFTCEAAADGAEALTRFRSGHHQLVVTDLRMPNVNGHLLATELLGSSPRPRVVVFTGVMEPAIVRDLLMRGVDDVITKPCDVKIFAAKMAALMEGRDRRPAGSSSSVAGPEQSFAMRQLEVELEPLSLCVSSSARELLKSTWETVPNPPEELGNYVSRLRSRTGDSQHHLSDAIDFFSPVACLPVDRQSNPVGSAFKLMGIELSSSSMRLIHTRQKKDYLALRWPSLVEEKRWRHAVARVQNCRPMTHLYEIVVDFVVLDQ